MCHVATAQTQIFLIIMRSVFEASYSGGKRALSITFKLLSRQPLEGFVEDIGGGHEIGELYQVVCIRSVEI